MCLKRLSYSQPRLCWVDKQWCNQANGEKKQTWFYTIKTAEAEVKIKVQPWNPTSSIQGIWSFEQTIDPLWRTKCHVLPPGGKTKAYRESLKEKKHPNQVISDHIKKTQNLVKFFPTFIDKSCVSFSYLKKNKKNLCHHWNITRPKLSCVPKNQRFELKSLYSIMVSL